MSGGVWEALNGSPCDDNDHVWGDWQQSRMAGTWHRPCLNCRCITLDAPDDDDSDDDWADGIDSDPWCELHNAPHLMGGLACELRSAENLLS